MTSVAESTGAPEVKMPSSAYMIAVMTLVATICGLLIVGTYQMTKNAIAHNKAQMVREAIQDKETGVIPTATKLVTYALGADGQSIEKVDESAAPAKKFIAAYDDSNALVGIAIEGSARGYGGPISAVCAFSPDKKAITKLRVIDQKETPGLGDKILKDKDFLANFDALSVTYDEQTKKITQPIVAVRHGKKKDAWQVDAISGATISSKAVARLLAESTQEMVPVIMANLDQIKRGE